MATTRVAIVGGGISGLVCALALSKSPNITLDLYESAPQLAERGAGLTMWGRSWSTLKALGLEHDMQALLSHPRDDKPALAFEFRKGDQPQGFGFYNLIINGGPIHFHRSDFQQVLLAHIPDTIKAHFHLSSKIIGYTETTDSPDTGPVQLLFEDGTTKSFDLLIGADGIRSVVRRVLLTDHARHVDQHRPSGPDEASSDGTDSPSSYLLSIDPIWTGWVAYRGLIPSATLREKMPNHRTLTIPTQYWGKRKYLVVYPIAQGRLINVVVPIRLSPTEGPALPWPWVTSTASALSAHPSGNSNIENVVTNPGDAQKVTSAAKQDILKHYANWDAESRVLLEVTCIERPYRDQLLKSRILHRQCLDSPSCWAIHALRPLKTYISRSKRVALLGDAAHAMTPHQGAGAGQAIEDAYILCSLLTSDLCTPSTIPSILHVYNAICQPFGNRVQAGTKAQGAYHDLSGPRFDGIEEGDSQSLTAEALHGVMEGIVEEWKWQWSTTADKERDAALAMLRERLMDA
ncbi:hypothetical protein HGRIS_010732 [Hohenbuehelia grisea]|uniref:FAD-binding domain-containing protein n=1 Tax=Hohenbuehelia grisea TaxID=104357 RepID=A0ABR3IYG5_9AGAR